MVEPLFEPELRGLVPEDRDAVVELPVERLFDVEPERLEARVVPELLRVVFEREPVERVEAVVVRPERVPDEPPEARPVVPERDDVPALPLVLRDVVERPFAADARVLVAPDRDAVVPRRLVPLEERLAVPPLDDFVVRAFDERDAELPDAERADPVLARLPDPVPDVFDFRAGSFVDAVLFLGNVYLLGVFRRLQDPQNRVAETARANSAATRPRASPGRRCPSCQCRRPRHPDRRS